MFKVIPNNPEESPKPIPVAKFPKLMIHDEGDVISLFLSESESICIQGTNCNLETDFAPGGKRLDENHIRHYKDYNLPITIQNILE